MSEFSFKDGLLRVQDTAALILAETVGTYGNGYKGNNVVHLLSIPVDLIKMQKQFAQDLEAFLKKSFTKYPKILDLDDDLLQAALSYIQDKKNTPFDDHLKQPTRKNSWPDELAVEVLRVILLFGDENSDSVREYFNVGGGFADWQVKEYGQVHFAPRQLTVDPGKPNDWLHNFRDKLTRQILGGKLKRKIENFKDPEVISLRENLEEQLLASDLNAVMNDFPAPRTRFLRAVSSKLSSAAPSPRQS